MNEFSNEDDDILGHIAIIGMAGQFPSAKNTTQFWENVKNGVESIQFFTDEELLAEGISSSLIAQPNYVKAKGTLGDVSQFDAAFFSISPKEAEIIDPQHRLFLECAWEALEDAGYDPERYTGEIGLYAGTSGVSPYLTKQLIPNPSVMETLGDYQTLLGNDKDFLCTRVSYKLNLKGPSVTIQTACSTSLVAVINACRALLHYQCDMALAGGVAITLPSKSGYLYQEGMILSPDGHCRTFDAEAHGTVPGNGAGIVVLKRMEDALEQRDHIYAVIRGSHLNNDGSRKISFTAPSIDGQAQVIQEAMALANVAPETITYVEAHGTGTALGDPIEIAALTQAFDTNAKHYCALGSVKTNIGHLDAAAGVANLIKATLALHHGQLPPSLHFKTPNAEINFDNSPFYVNTSLSDWQMEDFPRRAGVSAFGVGGTNAHVVLEETPELEPSSTSRPWQLLLLSAKTTTALDAQTKQLAKHFEQHAAINLADAAYTLQTGRQAFEHRRIVVCQTQAEAVERLTLVEETFTGTAKAKSPPVVFMFSGQGSQYLGMGRELYQHEAVFREQLDRCANFLHARFGLDLHRLLYAESSDASTLQQTGMTQPVLFSVEYALAQLWMAWGIQPTAMIGHSIGEYVAACLAGVFDLETALTLITVRGQLVQSLQPGNMLAVSLSEQALQALLPDNLEIAILNAPEQCVVSGTQDAIQHFASELEAKNIVCRHLHTSHAFHSTMLEPALPIFQETLKTLSLYPPQMPYVSNVTGTWITEEEATDPHYWVRHLRHTVRFNENLQVVLDALKHAVLLEIGPGRTLSTFAHQNAAKTAEHKIFTSLPHPKETISDMAFALNTLGKLWVTGVPIDWDAFYQHEKRYRVPLPTYPFERQSYWVKAGEPTKVSSKKYEEKAPDMADWFYVPSWKRADVIHSDTDLFQEQTTWLVFVDPMELGEQLVQTLEEKNQRVIQVKQGTEFAAHENNYTVNPKSHSDYIKLVTQILAVHNTFPEHIVHSWQVNEASLPVSEALPESKYVGFYSLIFLTQALGEHAVTTPMFMHILSNGLQSVTGEETLQPEKALILGPCKVIPQEYPNIVCHSIDIPWPMSHSKLLENVLLDCVLTRSNEVTAYRGQHRWTQVFESIVGKPQTKPFLREHGVYLITGGLGNIGLAIAKRFAEILPVKLVLTGRSTFPEKTEWDTWIETHAEGDLTSQRIKKLQAIEMLGSEVFVVTADVVDLAQMQTLLAKIETQQGQLCGVIHAAGHIHKDAFPAIKDTTEASCEQQFQPKVIGTLNLATVLQDKSLDFCCLFSSLSSILGGLGFSSYAAANAFLDTFVIHQNRTFTKWLSINWDGWDFDYSQQPTSLSHLAMTPEEGTHVFQYLMGFQTEQMIVSTGNLDTRLHQWVKREVDGITSTNSDLTLSNQDALEKTLGDIWCQFLGIAHIDVHDDFFELGGDSLLAVQLISKLRSVLHMDLSPHLLLNCPTIKKLTQFVKQEQVDEQPSVLVEIQAGETFHPPLFLVHPVGGHVYFYRHLAIALGRTYPVYGLQAQGIDGKLPPITSIDAMVEQYISAIRTVQPKGPYHLGGSSFGGTVAFEMAQTLRQQGEDIALLAMIDTPSPQQLLIPFKSDVEILAYLLDLGDKVSEVSAKLEQLGKAEQLEYFLKHSQVAKDLGIDANIEQARHFLDLFKANVQTLQDYHPTTVFPGTIHFFRAKERDNVNPHHPEQGWFQLAENVNVYQVSGNHVTINYPPHILDVAAQLKNYLENT